MSGFDRSSRYLQDMAVGCYKHASSQVLCKISLYHTWLDLMEMGVLVWRECVYRNSKWVFVWVPMVLCGIVGCMECVYRPACMCLCLSALNRVL
jgi:hypothetical protein